MSAAFTNLVDTPDVEYRIQYRYPGSTVDGPWSEDDSGGPIIIEEGKLKVNRSLAGYAWNGYRILIISPYESITAAKMSASVASVSSYGDTFVMGAGNVYVGSGITPVNVSLPEAAVSSAVLMTYDVGYNSGTVEHEVTVLISSTPRFWTQNKDAVETI